MLRGHSGRGVAACRRGAPVEPRVVKCREQAIAEVLEDERGTQAPVVLAVGELFQSTLTRSRTTAWSLPHRCNFRRGRGCHKGVTPVLTWGLQLYKRGAGTARDPVGSACPVLFSPRC